MVRTSLQVEKELNTVYEKLKANKNFLNSCLKLATEDDSYRNNATLSLLRIECRIRELEQEIDELLLKLRRLEKQLKLF